MTPDARRFSWLLRRYLGPQWIGVSFLLVTTALATALAAVFPLLMAPILDLALGSPIVATGRQGSVGLGQLDLKNMGTAFLQWFGAASTDHRFRTIAVLCAVYVAAGFLKGWLDFGNYLLALKIRLKAAAAMQTDVFRHLLSLSMSFFTRNRTGELVSRLDHDAHVATGGLETIVGTLLTTPVLIGVYGYFLLRTSPKLALAGLGAAVLHYGLTRGIRGPIRRLALGQFSALADLVARFQEVILSIRVVKSFGVESFEVKRVVGALGAVQGINLRYGVYKHVEEPARAMVNYAVEASILLIAAWELLAGHLGAPAFFLFLYVGRSVIVQIGLLGGAYTQIQAILAASSRVCDLLDQVPEVKDGPYEIAAFDDRIALQSVSFGYGGGEPVLRDVDFEIKRGDIVALVGPSGVGKSTLADLVLRLYDPTAGAVTIDGRDLRTLRQESYRRLFGVVSQEALLFNATIRENIAYGREGVSEADIVRAARIANVHDFVAQFPQGYDTVVGDRGVRLSGGQRQRVAIARAIVGRPAVLILDEATSSLDTESERLVQQAIDRVIEGTTSIVIAHRLSTVLHADKIVVLNHGTVEAIGQHAELIATNPTYARLYRLQFSDAEAPVGNV